MTMTPKPDASAPPLESKPLLGLILLTALWAYSALLDLPLLVRLAFFGTRLEATIVDCNSDSGQSCRARTVESKGSPSREALLRNSLLSSFKVGSTISVRLVDDDARTLRAEGQIARSAALRLLSGGVLIGLWVRQWAKSRAPQPR